ncbi:MAG: hypothetical protein DRQ56_05150 [Gammaproteobacteria bacterium]|nr:MAG: hypothetical protein DRQ56_05150 [Gammaproteobacteria bacterium]
MRTSAGKKIFHDRGLKECRPRILSAANDLISEFGFEGTTMRMVADKSGLSVEKLKAEYSDKQQILNELIGFHLDVYEGIRIFTRTNPDFSPLQSFQREWELMCEHMNNNQETLLAYLQNQSNIASWIWDRINQLRSQDIELLEKACALRELSRVNAASLEAVIYGTLWSLIFEFVQEPGRANFTVIPGKVSSMVLAPLILRDGVN